MFKIDKFSDLENSILSKTLCSEHDLEFEFCDRNFPAGFKYISDKLKSWAQSHETFNIIGDFESPARYIFSSLIISHISVTSFENVSFCKVFLSPFNGQMYYCGIVDSYEELPLTSKTGHYYVSKTGNFLYMWDGRNWVTINN